MLVEFYFPGTFQETLGATGLHTYAGEGAHSCHYIFRRFVVSLRRMEVRQRALHSHDETSLRSCHQGALWPRCVVILSVTVGNRGSLLVVALGIPSLLEKWERRPETVRVRALFSLSRLAVRPFCHSKCGPGLELTAPSMYQGVPCTLPA